MEITQVFLGFVIYAFLIAFTWYFQRSIIVSALKKHHYWIKQEEESKLDKHDY